MRSLLAAAAVAAALVPTAAHAEEQCASVQPTGEGDRYVACVTVDEGCVTVWTNQLQTTKPVQACAP